MELIPATLCCDEFPDEIVRYIKDVQIYDSSGCQSKTYYIERDCGYFLKIAPAGTLEGDAVMDAYFSKKGLSAKVCEYISIGENDYLITERIRGKDGITQKFLDNPAKIADAFGENLAMLHAVDWNDCPRKGRTCQMFDEANHNYCYNKIDPWMLVYTDIHIPQQAWQYMLDNRSALKEDVLLHGDYCLPNILLNDDYSLGGFIDVGFGGAGDRHFDLFWGAWSLQFNVKSQAYQNRFFDAYGRQNIDRDRYNLNGIIAALIY